MFILRYLISKKYTLSILVLSLLLSISLPGYSQEGRQTLYVTDVVIEGNVNVDESLIQSLAVLKKGNIFTNRDVSTSIKQIYRLGLFEDVRILAAVNGNAITLTIFVKEYPLLEKIEFKGNNKMKTKNLEREATIYQGQAVSPYRRKINLDKLLKVYREKGYLLAEVSDRIFVTNNLATLEMTINEGKKVKLGEIYVEGNEHLSDKKIKKAIKKKSDNEKEHFWKEGDLRRERLMDQFEKVVNEYRKNGFRQAKVLEDSLWFSENKERMHLKLKVSEGPQAFMGDIQFEGNEVLTDDQLSRIFELKKGEIFDEEKYDKSLAKLYEGYGELGYLYANPFPQESSRGDSIDVRVSLNEGSPAKVHRVNIIGNTKTKDKVIRREMIMKPGQVFQRSALMRSQRDIFQLNFFQDVVPDIQPLPNGDVDVTMLIQEKPTGTANAGAGFSGLDGLVGTLSLVIPNFLGNGQTVNFGWEFGSRRNSINMGFSEPWLFDTPTSAGVDLFRTERFWFGQYRVKERGFGLNFGRRFRGSYYSISGGYRLADLSFDFTDSDPSFASLAESVNDQAGITSSVSNSLVRDSRNLPQFASAGSRNTVTTVFAGLGGSIKYLKQLYTADWYLPLFSGTSASFRSRYGYVNNPFSSRVVPSNERFYPGGVSFDGMIRGYGNNSVGPYTVLTDSTGVRSSFRNGAQSMTIFTIEYQVPIIDQRQSTSPVYAIAFAEMGNAWAEIDQTSLNFKKMKKSMGLGIRVVMPLVGIMGFDFGYGFNAPSDPLQAEQQKRSGWNTHFQLGQVF